MNSFGFKNIDGMIQFANTADVFDQLEGDYGRTGFTTEETEEFDELRIAKLTKVHMRQYLFVQMSGPANSSDFTIIPIEINVDFKIAFKDGHGHPLGAMPDITGYNQQYTIQINKCEFVSNPNK